MRMKLALGAALFVAAAAPLAATAASSTVTISPPPTATFSVTLSGADQTGVASLVIPVSYTSNAHNKFAQNGWQITATSTIFTGTSTGRTLSAAATSVSVVDDASCTDQNCSDPVNSIGYPLALPAGTVAPPAIAIVDAAPGSGVGSNTETLQLNVAIPANTYADTYKSSLTLAVVEGP